MHSTIRLTPKVPVWAVGRAFLNLDKSRLLVGLGIHVGQALREFEARDRYTQTLSNKGDVGADVDGTTYLFVLLNTDPVMDHEEHQIGPL